MSKTSHKPLITRRILPPFGKDLKERLAFYNPPIFAVVCVGKDCWKDAKIWSKRSDISPMVLESGKQPDEFDWPVENLRVVIDWSVGPDADFIIKLCEQLFADDADLIVVRPLFVDREQQAFTEDKSKPPGERWQQKREMTRIIRNPLKHNQKEG